MASNTSTTTGTTELWRIGIPDESYAFNAPRPGNRDLGSLEFWERSMVRSRLRRESAAARKVGIKQGARSRLAMALVGVTLAVPATEAITAGTAQAAPVTDTTLRHGDSGSRVAALQHALGITADGKFGAATNKAVRAYQRAHGLAVDGVVGAMTAAALGLNGSHANAPTPAKASSRSSAPSSVTSDPALSSETIAKIQAKLEIATDGRWGPQTRSAVREYQRQHGLEVDGVPGPATLGSMGLKATAAPAENRDSAVANPNDSPSTGAASAISAARSKAGSPYSYGATGPSSFDCSGLVQWSFKQAGVTLPRTSFQQYGQGTAVSKPNIQAGDLIFFNTAGPGASDVGIATSPTTVISATSSRGVMEHPIFDSYWGSHFVGAKRL